MSQRPQKRESSSSYRVIHGRQTPPAQHLQYFPSRGHQITTREPSESSRRSQKQSFSSSLATDQSQQLSKQNERLRKEISKLQGVLLPHQDQKATLKNLELELVETYRVIHYYDGKLKELQGICLLYEREFGPIDHKKGKQTKVGAELIEELRKANAELKGKNAQQSFELQIINNQLRKMEYKYHSIQQQLLQANKKFPASNNTQSIPLLINRDSSSSNRKPTKFIDDYQHNNLICSPKQQPIKRRPLYQLSKGKKILTKANGESDSDGSGASIQYKNSVYIKRQKEKNASSKQHSLRQSKHQSTVFGNLSSRLNSIQGEIQSLRKENERLQEELDQKTKQVLNFEEKIQDLEQKKSLSPQSREPQQKIIVKVSKQRLNQIPNPNQGAESRSNNSKPQLSPLKIGSNGSNNLSQFVSNINGPKAEVQKHSQVYSFKYIKQTTIRKISVHLARQCISYLNFIENLSTIWSSTEPQTLKQTLQQQPYRLTSSQSDQFLKQGEEMVRINGRDSSKLKGILRECIPFFNNITIRRDYTLNIQTANKFKNYSQELQLLTSQYGNRMPYQRFPDFVAKLYLTPEEALFLQIKNAQQYEDYEFFHLADLLKYFLLQ